MSNEIIEFYKKTLEEKNIQSEKNSIEEKNIEEIEKPEIVSSSEPFDIFLSKLSEKIEENSNKPIQEELVVDDIEKKVEVEDTQPFNNFLESLVQTVEKDKLKKEEGIKEDVISFIGNLKNETKIESKIKRKPNKKIKQNNISDTIPVKEENDIIEVPVPEENDYVKHLEDVDKGESKILSKIDKNSNIKNIISEQVKEEVSRIKTQISRMAIEGGGGSVAVQYANGGTMNGDLNVTGRYLSAGVDLGTLFQNNSLGSSDRLISGNKSLILNQDGSLDFPNNTIYPKDESIITIQSSNSALDTFTKLSLTPHGIFAYDVNSNSITIDSIENDIIITSQDTYEWKFDSEGILTGPNGNLVVGNIETVGNFVSGGKNLSTIIFEQSPYGMWLSAGNTGTQQQFLSSLRGVNGLDNYQLWLSAGNTGTQTDFLSSLKGERGLNGLNGANNYQLWLSAGNIGTLTDFLSSIKGEKGDVGSAGLTGDSAYNIWLSQGNIGTITDFLSSLKGEKGSTGNTVTNTDALTEGSVNLFFRDDRAAAAAPVKSVNNKTGDVQIGISDIPNLLTTLNSKQVSGNYVELVNGFIPSNYIAGGVDEIQEYTNYDSLTSTGTAISNVLYVTLDTNKIYRWGGSVYVEIVGSPGSTDAVPEGSVNKYFTTQRASNAAPVQSVAGKTGNVSLQISDVQNLTTSLTSTNTTTTAITAKMSGTIGSYSNNSVIPINTPFEVILRNLLTTQIPVTYIPPTLSVAYGSPSIVTTYEVGSTVPSFTITPTYTQRDGGTLVGYSYLRNGTVLGSGTTYNMSSFQITTTNTIQVSARYNDGPVYNDNLGNPDNNNIKAGSLINTATLNVMYPYFYGKSSTQPTAASIASAIQAGTATKVLADANGTVSITYNANGEFVWFAHLGTQTSKTKWFFTTLNSGDIGAGSFVSTPVTQNVTSPQGFWTNVQYKVYIGGYSTSTTGAVEFRN